VNAGRRVLRIVILIICILTCVTGTAFSFSHRGLDLKIAGIITEIYDDNIESSKDKKQDIKTKLTVELDTYYAGKASFGEFKSSITREMFADNSELTNTNGTFSGSVTKRLSDLENIALNDTYVRTFEPADVEGQFASTVGRSKSSLNRFQMSYSRTMAKDLGFTARYSNEVSRSSSSDNSIQNSLSFSGAYTYSPDITFLLSYEAAQRDYESANDITRHTVYAQIQKYLNKKVYITGLFGGDFLKFSSSDISSEYSEYIRVSLSSDMTRNLSTEISYEKRSQIPSFEDSIFDSWMISASFSGAVSDRLKVSANSDYGRGEYKQRGFIDKFFRAIFFVNYNLNKYVDATFRYSYNKRESDDIEDIRSFEKNMVSGGLRVTY
jgi:hypothetical protein